MISVGKTSFSQILKTNEIRRHFDSLSPCCLQICHGEDRECLPQWGLHLRESSDLEGDLM